VSLAPTIADLHRQAARAGFPASELHGLLHDWAEQEFGVRSLAQLEPEQRIACSRWISEIAEQAGRQAREIDRRRGAAVPPAPSSSRPRSGRPSAPGTVRIASQAQRGLIRKLVKELGWTNDHFAKVLRQQFGEGSADPDTSKGACRLINILIGHKRSMDRKLRKPSSERRAM